VVSIRRRLRIVPQFGRSYDLTVTVQHHEAVLLTGDRQRYDLSSGIRVIG
jgi:hypothetical protein